MKKFLNYFGPPIFGFTIGWCLAETIKRGWYLAACVLGLAAFLVIAYYVAKVFQEN